MDDTVMMILYVLMIVILAIIGWYIGKSQDAAGSNQKAMIGGVVGGLAGLAGSYLLHSYNGNGPSASSYIY